MAESLTVRVRAKGDGLLRAVGPTGALLARYVGRGSDGLPLPQGELVPALRDGEGLVPASPLYRRAIDDGDLETVETEPASAPVEETPVGAADVSPTKSTLPGVPAPGPAGELPAPTPPTEG